MSDIVLPIEHRTIASVLVFSSDEKLLMGRKDPAKGGVYPDAWHIPGGGTDPGETLEDTACRELFEETGLLVKPNQLRKLASVGQGEFIKTKPDGTKVLCVMEFNRFVVKLPQPANELAAIVKESDDLISLQWFEKHRLVGLEMTPGSKEYMLQEGFIDKR